MDSLRLSLDASELAGRMRERLRGGGGGPPIPRVVWQRDAQRVLIHLDSLVLRALDGWLIAGLDLQTDPTGRQTLQMIYHLGKDGEGDGLAAAATMNSVTVAAAQLAERWATTCTGCCGTRCSTRSRPRWGAPASDIPASRSRCRALAARTTRSLSTCSRGCCDGRP